MSFDSNLTFEEKLQKKISIPLSAVTTIKIINNIMLQRSLALLTKLSEAFHVHILIELPSKSKKVFVTPVHKVAPKGRYCGMERGDACG